MKAQKTLQITPNRCIGCLNCELACASRDWGQFFPSPSRINLVFFQAGGQVPVSCFQCDAAPCLAVCRAKALSRDEAGGVVTTNPERCLGCRACVSACPFGNITYAPAGHRAVKCDLCQGSPRCASACPSRALEYVEEDAAVRNKRQVFAAGVLAASKGL
jgi:Fe-S-cluster-containing hydrogenase component 2